MRRARRNRADWKEYYDDQIKAEVAAFVTLCFGMLEGVSNASIADNSGLALSTVGRLRRGETLHPWINTVVKLGHEAGLQLVWHDGKVVVDLVKKKRAG